MTVPSRTGGSGDRATRLVALVRLLTTTGGMTIKELSGALGVSQRTVRRHIKDVTEAGFHSVCENGRVRISLENGAVSKPAHRPAVSLKSAIEKLIAHPAVGSDPRMVGMLKEIAAFASKRSG